MKKDEILYLRKEKVRKEIEAAKRLMNQGIEPLKSADSLIHSTLIILREGYKSRYPELNEKQLMEKIKKHLLLREKLKSRKKGVSFG